MRYFLIGFTVLISFLFYGCGYKEGIMAGDQKAFLYFSGDTKDVMVSVDGKEKFSVESGRDNQYKIKPGKHTVRVYRDEKLIVERKIYVGDEIAKEIILE